MTLTLILVSIAVASLLGLLVLKPWRIYLLLAVSTLAIYALQPELPVRGLDFWLPTFSLGLTILAWEIGRASCRERV